MERRNREGQYLPGKKSWYGSSFSADYDLLLSESQGWPFGVGAYASRLFIKPARVKQARRNIIADESERLRQSFSQNINRTPETHSECLKCGGV
jgi:hypothetical protein